MRQHMPFYVNNKSLQNGVHLLKHGIFFNQIK